MLDSDVRPITRITEELLVTGKKRNARQMFPTRPSNSPALSNFASHLPKTKSPKFPMKKVNGQTIEIYKLYVHFLSQPSRRLSGDVCKHFVDIGREGPEKECYECE